MKTRFSPSPTGQMHLGNVRTALFSFLLARHHPEGRFLLRIEDTDLARSKPEYVQLLQEDLQWAELLWDEGPFFQSARHAIYSEYYTYLEEHHRAYPCFCSDEELALSRRIQLSQGQPPRYAGTCRGLSPEEIAAKKAQGFKPALRFKVPPEKDIQFQDLIKGLQRFQSQDIGDFIIRRHDGTASFFFSNAVDDALMGVTHVLRGEDHLTNTPRQILILIALGLPIPQYGHLSLILSEQGSPLSKREGSLSLEHLRSEGFLSIALCNYLGRLGHYYEKNHLMTLAEMAEHFSLTRVGKTAAHFDYMQLLHFQKLAVMHTSDEIFWQWIGEETRKLVPEPLRAAFTALMQPHVLFPKEAFHWAEIFFKPSSLSFTLEAREVLQKTSKDFLKHLEQLIQQENGDYINITQLLSRQFNLKGKALFQPLRAALTGEISGPELQGIFNLLGKQGLLEKLACASLDS